MKKRILCIEDDKDTCELLAFSLGKAGYEVVLAHTIADGLTQVGSGNFNLVILDSNLPDGSGIKLCRQIRGIGHQIPVIFFSADAYPNQIDEAMQSGAQAYITKPIDPSDVIRTIGKLLG